MVEKTDGKRMSAIDWQGEVSRIAGPMLATDTRESWLARAARRSGITYRQCKAPFYGERTDPRVSVAVPVLRAAQEAREEARQLAAQFENLAGALNARDEDFHSEDVLALINAARALRGLDRT